MDTSLSSKMEVRRYRKRQQRYFKAPSFPGASSFDLKNDLQEMPKAKRKRTAAPQKLYSPSLTMVVSTTENTQDPSLHSIGHHTGSMGPTMSTSTVSIDLHNGVSALPNTDIPSQLLHNSFVRGDLPSSPLHDQGGLLTPTSSQGASFHDLEMRRKNYVMRSDSSRSTTGHGGCQYRIRPGGEVVLFETASIKATISLPLRQARPDDFLADCFGHATRTTSLLDYYDFFEISQDLQASPTLRYLAIKYAVPRHKWWQAKETCLNFLHQHVPCTKQALDRFGTLLAGSIEKLVENVPELSREWKLIKENLQHLLTALRRDGIDIPCPLIEHWNQDGSKSVNLRRNIYQPMTGIFFGDEELPEWYVQAYLQDEVNSLEKVLYEENLCASKELGTSHLGVVAWVQYGRMIATSFHVYCLIFMFLAKMEIVEYFTSTQKSAMKLEVVKQTKGHVMLTRGSTDLEPG